MFARAFADAIHIEDTGDKDVVHVRYDRDTDSVQCSSSYQRMPLSMVKADIILRHGYPVTTPCAIISNRLLSGGDDVVMPLAHFPALFRYDAATGGIQLRITGPRGDTFGRTLAHREKMWGSVPTVDGVKHGRFCFNLEDQVRGALLSVLFTACCLMFSRVLRRCGWASRSTTLTA